MALLQILRMVSDKLISGGQCGEIILCLISMPAFGVKASIQLPNPVGVV